MILFKLVNVAEAVIEFQMRCGQRKPNFQKNMMKWPITFMNVLKID